jgi:hypothetical protein
MDLVSVFNKCISFLRSSTFDILGVHLSLFDFLIGGFLLYLVIYLIFRVGD